MNQTILNLKARVKNRPYATSASLFVVAFAIFIMLPIKLTRSVSVPCKILPARQWLLVRTPSGGVMATVNDYVEGTMHEYSVVNVLRGDAFRLDLSSSFSPGNIVRTGDTVVAVHSSELVREFHRLSGELAVAQASLEAVRSGEKESITQEAERALLLARERERMLRLIALREDSLQRKNLISLEEYELARSAAEAASLEIMIAEARLQIVRTGAKPEQIQLVRSQIAEFDAQLKALTDQLAAMTMVAPFGGVFSSSPGTDTLCAVEDTSRVALLEIPVRHLRAIAAGQTVTLRARGMTSTVLGTILRLDPRVKVTLGVQVVHATATLPGNGSSLPTGVVVAGSVETARLSPWEFTDQWLVDLFNEFVDGTSGT